MTSNCLFHERLSELEFMEYSKEGKSFFKNKKNKDVEVFWMDLRPGSPCPFCSQLL